MCQSLSGMRERHWIVAGRSQKCVSFCFHHPKEDESREIKHKFEVGQTRDCPIRVRNVCDPEFEVFDSLRGFQMNEAFDTIMVVFGQVRSLRDTSVDT